MALTLNKKNTYQGIGLAVLATIIWSGNFVVARGVIHSIPPVSLAFFRWATGTLILAPFAWKHFRRDLPLLKRHWQYLLWISICGITVYNTLIYIAGNYLPAINLALIGTTSSPVLSILLAALFLQERIRPLRVLGLLLCIAGILLLLSRGSWQNLAGFQFSVGDGWILLAALSFAVYNILVRKKPAGLSPLGFLFATFLIGTLLLIPFWRMEAEGASPIPWNGSLLAIILYLGIGNSVLSFLCWNAAIARLGAGRTSLFGNLIPVLSSLEAVWFLDETITPIHLVSGILVIGGLVIANLRKSNAGPQEANTPGKTPD